MKARYTIAIVNGKSQWRLIVYCTRFHKNHSTIIGGRNSIEECLDFIRNRALKEWATESTSNTENIEPATFQNTYFESVSNKITLSHILESQKPLDAFEVNTK